MKGKGKKGVYRFWSPVYVCVTPNTKGCKTKKITSMVGFIILVSALIVNMIWIIGANYYANTGEELIGYKVEAWSFLIGFILVLLSIVFLILNYKTKESNAFKVTKITMIVIGVLFMLWTIEVLFAIVTFS